MPQPATWMPSPPLSPDQGPIDLTHLSRMTLGESSLEREILRLFRQQAVNLLAQMKAQPGIVRTAAHTLKGSAQGIGAFGVASAADRLEKAADPAAIAELFAELERALVETNDAIVGLLRTS